MADFKNHLVDNLTKNIKDLQSNLMPMLESLDKEVNTKINKASKEDRDKIKEALEKRNIEQELEDIKSKLGSIINFK